jgi:O-antigen/teichoic acid export membrane protein
MAMAITWTDTLMLGYFMTEDIVGIYNAAVPTSLLLVIAPTLAAALFLPIISGFFSKNKIRPIKEAYLRINRWILLFNIPPLLILSVFSAEIISFLFGPVYVSGAGPLIILSIGYFVYALSIPLYRMAELFKYTKMYFYVNLFAALLNIVLNWFWIPRYGMIGAAIASAISLSLVWVIYYFSIYNKLRIHQVDKDLFKIILIAVIPAAIIYFAAKFALGIITPFWMVPMAAIYGLVYLGLAYKFSLIKPDEIELIMGFIRRFIPKPKPLK